MKKTQKSKRAMWVFTGLLTILTGTSALLLAVAPAPLKPDGASPLAAADVTFAPLEGLRATQVPVRDGRWEYIYIRHSKTPTSETPTVNGDHFVVHTAGASGTDGRVSMNVRWSNQASATPPQGVNEIHPRCVSIVLIGDLDRNVPTPAQVQAATRLVRTLQTELKIPADRVLMVDQRESAVSPAGVGRYFPLQAFRDNLLQ